MADWTDEMREELVAKYEAAKPTPDNTMDILADIAEEMDVTKNGARSILSRAGVWVKKEAAKASTSTTDSKEKKESKPDSIARLTKVIEAMDIEADTAIIGKLTGKAAAYFADTITAITGED